MPRRASASPSATRGAGRRGACPTPTPIEPKLHSCAQATPLLSPTTQDILRPGGRATLPRMPDPSTLSEHFERLLRGTAPPSSPSFDIEPLDRAVGEVRAGDLVLIGGHPGAPVDALLLYAALAAARRGEPTVLVAPSIRAGCVAVWLLSTTGLPLDVLWDGRVPDLVADVIEPSFAGLPITIVDGLGEGVGAVRMALDATPGVRCVVVLNVRWLDARTDARLLVFDLKRLARDCGVATFVGIDTRYPGPSAVERAPRPDLYPDPALVTLADVALLLSAPWIYDRDPADSPEFSAAVIAPAARRAFVGGLRSPRRTMQILPPDETTEGWPG